jgi:hypothetical protein
MRHARGGEDSQWWQFVPEAMCRPKAVSAEQQQNVDIGASCEEASNGNKKLTGLHL